LPDERFREQLSKMVQDIEQERGVILNQANIVLFRVTIQVEPSNVEISQKEDIPKGSKTFKSFKKKDCLWLK
jgi:hypothetical protein